MIRDKMSDRAPDGEAKQNKIGNEMQENKH